MRRSRTSFASRLHSVPVAEPPRHWVSCRCVRWPAPEVCEASQADGDSPITPDVRLTIDPASIDTGDTGRDQHLRAADFFDVEKFPSIEFVGKKLEKIDSNDYKLHGDLTIKGVTKRVTLDVEFGGIMKDPWGNEKAGLAVNGKINRNEFGLTFNAALETGGVLLGEEVKINAEFQLIKQ